MTPAQKKELRAFIPETLLYGALATAFCIGAAKMLGKPLQEMSKDHRVEYGLLALGLMIFQGFVLERITHAVCDRFRPRKDRT
jgi:hypothetical protein